MSIRIVAPGLVLVAAIVACQRSSDATAEKPGARVLAGIEGKHPCTHQSLAITGAPQLSNQERCALVEAGLEAIARGAAETNGVRGSDTMLIRGATITAFAFRDTSENPASSYWSIDYDIGDSAKVPTVHIDALSGLVTAGVSSRP